MQERYDAGLHRPIRINPELPERAGSYSERLMPYVSRAAACDSTPA